MHRFETLKAQIELLCDEQFVTHLIPITHANEFGRILGLFEIERFLRAFSEIEGKIVRLLVQGLRCAFDPRKEFLIRIFRP